MDSPLLLSKVACSPVINAGECLKYKITISNISQNTLTNIVLTEDMPMFVKLECFKQISGPKFFISVPCKGNGVLVAAIDNFPALSIAVFIMVVKVSPSTPTPNTITNAASVTATGISAINVSDPVSVKSKSIIKANKRGPKRAHVNSIITYKIKIANKGPSDAINIVIQETIPTGTQFVCATPICGPIFSSSATSTSVSILFPVLPAHSCAKFKVEFLVTSTTIKCVKNCINITSLGALTSPTTATPLTTPQIIVSHSSKLTVKTCIIQSLNNNNKMIGAPISPKTHLIPKFTSNRKRANVITKPAIKPVTNPVIKPTTKPVTNPTTNLVTKPATNPTTNLATKPATNLATNPTTNVATNPMTNPTTSAIVNLPNTVTTVANTTSNTATNTSSALNTNTNTITGNLGGISVLPSLSGIASISLSLLPSSFLFASTSSSLSSSTSSSLSASTPSFSSSSISASISSSLFSSPSVCASTFSSLSSSSSISALTSSFSPSISASTSLSSSSSSLLSSRCSLPSSSTSLSISTFPPLPSTVVKIIKRKI